MSSKSTCGSDQFWTSCNNEPRKEGTPTDWRRLTVHIVLSVFRSAFHRFGSVYFNKSYGFIDFTQTPRFLFCSETGLFWLSPTVKWFTNGLRLGSNHWFANQTSAARAHMLVHSQQNRDLARPWERLLWDHDINITLIDKLYTKRFEHERNYSL